jgi:hypothetical protein
MFKLRNSLVIEFDTERDLNEMERHNLLERVKVLMETLQNVTAGINVLRVTHHEHEVYAVQPEWVKGRHIIPIAKTAEPAAEEVSIFPAGAKLIQIKEGGC